jgi:hypothetical protein
VLRDETRLEAMIGVNVQVRRFSFVAALAPWFLLRSGETTFQTAGTSDFSQSWGVALVLTPTVGADPIGRVAEWLSGGADDDS